MINFVLSVRYEGKLGNETLQEWATTEAVRVALSVKEQLPSAKKHIKKNSGGTPSTEK